MVWFQSLIVDDNPNLAESALTSGWKNNESKRETLI